MANYFETSNNFILLRAENKFIFVVDFRLSRMDGKPKSFIPLIFNQTEREREKKRSKLYANRQIVTIKYTIQLFHVTCNQRITYRSIRVSFSFFFVLFLYRIQPNAVGKQKGFYSDSHVSFVLVYTQICRFIVNSAGQHRYHRHINNTKAIVEGKKKFFFLFLFVCCRVKSIFFLLAVSLYSSFLFPFMPLGLSRLSVQSIIILLLMLSLFVQIFS